MGTKSEKKKAKAAKREAERQQVAAETEAKIARTEAKYDQAISSAMEEKKKDENCIRADDVVVRARNKTCAYGDHKIRNVRATVCVFSPKRGVSEMHVNAFCCPTCRKYYILENDFDRLKRMGGLCCEIIEKPSKTQSYKQKRSKLQMDLSEQSIFNSLGYNVNQQDALTARERRTILDFVILNRIKTQKQTIGFLEHLIDFNGRKEGMRDAVANWQSDIDYLKNDPRVEMEKFRIRRIFVETRKW